MLVRPRWIALSAAVVLVAAMCVRLGFWQLHRHEARSAANAIVAASAAQPPAPVATVLQRGVAAAPSTSWRTVTSVGRYDAAQTILIRNQTHEGRAGVHVVVPLVTAEGTALLVNRGFVPRSGGASATVQLPQPPAGEVSVTGAVRPAQGTGDTVVSGGAQRSVPRLDVAALRPVLPYPTFGNAVDLREERPGAPTAPALPDPPRTGFGPNLSYAVQWWVFALFALGGWVLLLRRDLREEAQATTSGDARRGPLASVTE
jgi:cytochrome oxidase assembly protein ShyY1